MRKSPLSYLRPGLLTVGDTGGTSDRSSGRDAYFIALPGYQLSLPCSTTLCLAEVLFEDVAPIEAVGP
jgi:hypothetical protein